MNEIVKVFVGADRSQALAIKVLEHSIKRHSSLPVEVHPMIDLPVPQPQDPRNTQRTGFSFSRFCIPKLNSYKGKAIYMDADMIVFKDIKLLWEIPMDDAKVAIQSEVTKATLTVNKHGAPKKRIKQCAVMLINCSELKWDVNEIIAGMDKGKYNYEELMYHLCILDEKDIKYELPGHWNSLEYWDEDTSLLHYTDVATQPWTSTLNTNAKQWLDEVRMMLENGSLSWEELLKEIDLGYFRPSLVRDIKIGHKIPFFFSSLFNRYNGWKDKISGYIPHRDVYAAKKKREQAIAEYEKKLKLA